MINIVKISSIALYIINRIRVIRVNLGISTRDVQKILDLDPDGSILGAIESNKNPAKYHDEHLNKLARAFTDKSHKLGYNITYTLNDFYPPTNFEEKMVEKIIIKIEAKELGQTGTLQLLVVEENDSFFDGWHSAKEIAEYCGNKADKKWEAKDFTAIIEQAVKKGILIRKSENEALFKRA